MKKKNKLYTANKWNQPLFAQGIDREHQNIFDGLLSSSIQNIGTTSVLGNPTKIDVGKIQAMKTPSQGLGLGIGNIAKKVGSAAGVGLAGAGLAQNVGDSQSRNGFYDTLDPVYHLAGGRESTLGNGLSDAGVSTFQAGAQSGNGYMMLAGAGLKVLGGLTNAAFGIKTDKTRLNAINTGLSTLNNYQSNATSFDEIQGPTTMVDSGNVYKGGWFSKGKARRKNNALNPHCSSLW